MKTDIQIAIPSGCYGRVGECKMSESSLPSVGTTFSLQIVCSFKQEQAIEDLVCVLD